MLTVNLDKYLSSLLSNEKNLMPIKTDEINLFVHFLVLVKKKQLGLLNCVRKGFFLILNQVLKMQFWPNEHFLAL